MFHLIDHALEQYLRSEVPLPSTDVDVAFNAPAKDWSARLSRPTVNLFLWDIRRSAAQQRAGLEEVEIEGNKFRRIPPRALEMRYLVTAWSSEHRDEHQLLGNVAQSILSNRWIPNQFLPDGFELPDRRPVELSLTTTSDLKPNDFWSSIDGQLKPGLDIIVTFRVATTLTEVAEPASEVDVGLGDKNDPSRSSSRSYVTGRTSNPDAVGRAVRTRRGKATVQETGNFVVPGEPGDELTIDSEPPLTTEIPADGRLELE
ncbi:MAG: DUF4255 domain-containing protein [Acidimicrobiales bacterium]|nr:DUF4255 domain-containing protein [Acidimicrobiales bacterium]